MKTHIEKESYIDYKAGEEIFEAILLFQDLEKTLHKIVTIFLLTLDGPKQFAVLSLEAQM